MASGGVDALPEEIQKSLTDCEESLDKLESVLEPLLSTPWETLTARLENEEKARLNLMMAYAVESLYFIYLKTQGENTENHQVTEELNRIKAYMKKLRDASGNTVKEKQRLKLNKDAASRFINSGLGKKTRNEDDEGEDEDEDEVEESGKKKEGKQNSKKKARKQQK